MPTNANNLEYINSIEYSKLETKLKKLQSITDDNAVRNRTSRNLRYVEIDIEAERGQGKLLPDELIIPQHTIDTNIRREQAAYVQYDTQSPRAAIFQPLDDPTIEVGPLEKDFTNKARFEGWQIPKFANIDGMQQNGYGMMELILDQSKAGQLAYEAVGFGDFAMPYDTKDVQEAEIIQRTYYFSKTRLLAMCDDKSWKFDLKQVTKVVEQEPKSDDAANVNVTNSQDKSLCKIQKIMFRVNGIVHVAWSCYSVCDNWIRVPRPLYLGRRKVKDAPTIIETLKATVTGVPVSDVAFETRYPYFTFPYLISENNTISQLKGRAFLDQDTQQAVMSIVSSYVTGLRRASGAYFSKEVEDPNDDILLQKNVFFRQGSLINSKVKSFQLAAPPAECLNAVNLLVSSNQQETSQVNFAAQNRKDSRKTATEIDASMQAQQQLSTVQVVLYSNSSKELYTAMFEIIQSRVNTGLIKVSPVLKQLYALKYSIRPSGDVDVIERQQMIQAMLTAWPVMMNTAAAVPFLCDLLNKMFPEKAAIYCQIIQQAQQQAQSAQAQQQQQLMQGAQQMAMGLVSLSKKPEMFSDTGKIHALPLLEQTAEQIETMTANSGMKQ